MVTLLPALTNQVAQSQIQQTGPELAAKVCERLKEEMRQAIAANDLERLAVMVDAYTRMVS